MSNKAPTQQELIIKYIYDFGSITPYEAFADLGITKLATRVSEMRKAGIEFHKERVDTKNRYGKACHYTKYSLENTAILEKIREIAKQIENGD